MRTATLVFAGVMCGCSFATAQQIKTAGEIVAEAEAVSVTTALVSFAIQLLAA